MRSNALDVSFPSKIVSGEAAISNTHVYQFESDDRLDGKTAINFRFGNDDRRY